MGTPLATQGEVHSSLCIVMDVLADLHVPVSLPKLEGMSTTVSFLGILIDTVPMELWLYRNDDSCLVVFDKQ